MTNGVTILFKYSRLLTKAGIELLDLRRSMRRYLFFVVVELRSGKVKWYEDLGEEAANTLPRHARA